MNYYNLLLGILLIIGGLILSIQQYTKENFKWNIGNQKLIFAGIFTILLGLFFLFDELKKL
jgi:uncharacterized membrane protein HdeD (DUF308 family)